MHLVPQGDGSDPSAALRSISQRARVLTRATGAAIALAHKGSMICRASVGTNAPTLGCRLDVSSGFSGECLRSGKALRCDNSDSDPRVDAESCRRLGVRSILAAPIPFEGEIVGLLEVFSSQRFAFHDGDLAVVEQLAETVLAAPAPIKPIPPPKLLLELEPAYRVFFGNLIDLLRPQPAPLKLTSLPARFWPDVFVPSRVPWDRFVQAMLLHIIMISGMVGLLELGLLQQHVLHANQLTLNRSDVIYYLPSEYPSTAGPSGQTERHSMERRPFVRQAAIHVPREPGKRSPENVVPPTIKLSHDLRLLRIVSWSPMIPAVPFSATTRSQVNIQATSATVVAPAPEISAVSQPRTLTVPLSGAVAPAPSVPHSVRQMASMSIGHLQVVAPAPGIAVNQQGSFSEMTHRALGSAATSVVPPPPSVSAGNQRPHVTPLSAGVPVVPPPPLVPNAGGSLRGGSFGGGSEATAGVTRIVPPPPSTNGLANAAAQGVSSMAATAQVVPPAPLVAIADRFLRSMFTGRAAPIVPPPPSASGIGNPDGQRLNSVSTGSTQVVPPAPLIRGAGGYTVGSSQAAAIPVVPPSPSINVGRSSGGRMASLGSGKEMALPPAVQIPSGKVGSKNTAMAAMPPGGLLPGEIITNAGETTADPKELADSEELSVNFVGPALVVPRSSYFSSYEVFIAEERVTRRQSRLIKLVYDFLPYQPRLSELGPDYPAIDNLRATRDPSCDETLLQVASSANAMDWFQGDLPHVNSKSQPQTMLPCYRTTADDYRRARAHHRR